MTPRDESHVHEAPVSPARYYRSLGSREPVVYVQEEGRWQIYADGRLTRESAGTIPALMLAQSEEINQGRARELMELERARAQTASAERQNEIRQEAVRRKAERKEGRSALLKAMLRFTAGLVLAVGISVGGFFAVRYADEYIRWRFWLFLGIGVGLVSAVVSLLVWKIPWRDLRHIHIPWAIAWAVVTLALWALIVVIHRLCLLGPWSS